METSTQLRVWAARHPSEDKVSLYVAEYIVEHKDGKPKQVTARYLDGRNSKWLERTTTPDTPPTALLEEIPEAFAITGGRLAVPEVGDAALVRVRGMLADLIELVKPDELAIEVED